MILQALATYYERLAAEGGVAPQGFKRIEIPFIIVLNMQIPDDPGHGFHVIPAGDSI